MFKSAVQRKAEAGTGASFVHIRVSDHEGARKVADTSPHRTQALFNPPAEAPQGETHVLDLGNSFRVASFEAKTPFIFESESNPDHLMMRFIARGSVTYSIYGTVIGRACAGDFTFRLARSPVIRATTSWNYASFLVSVPLPSDRRPFVAECKSASTDTFYHLKSGLFIAAQSEFWPLHFRYAINYALSWISEGADEGQDRIVSEYMYLTSVDELARHSLNQRARNKFKGLPFELTVAEKYIEMNARRAPSVAALAKEVGISERRLHKLFAKYRYTSPSDVIRDRRLWGVRRALQSAGPMSTVSSIANEWRYSNLGNFAVAYRERFGETPSETLSAALERSPAHAGAAGKLARLRKR